MATIRFSARLFRPGGKDKGAPWAFLNLPQEASDQLPSRGMVTVDGTINGAAFQATLNPDGKGGHWLKLDQDFLPTVKAQPGEAVDLRIAPVAEEPEPNVPDDFQEALAAAGAKARDTWAGITRVARRDWIFWITSGKKTETRVKRIEVAISKLSAGNRRPCCFDRSGMYDKSLSSPIPDTTA